MIALVPKPSPSAADLKVHRSHCGLSFSAIKQAAANGDPLRTFSAFEGRWEEEREVLARLARAYVSAPDAPYLFVDIQEDGTYEILPPEELREALRHLRDIEIEAQRQSDLEQGFITEAGEFEPHDEDWTAGVF